MKSVLRSLAIVVGLPTLLAAIYFGLFASDIYVSESRFAIRSATSGGGGGGLAAILASPIANSGDQDTMVVADYVHSHDMLERITESVDLRAHYADPELDRLARLDAGATQEQLLTYFEKRVQLVHDSQSGVLTLTVQAFDPGVAQGLATRVIELSERLVNDLSTRIEADTLATAGAEVDRGAERVAETGAALTRFRRQNTLLNPTAESSALLGVVTGIETRLIEARALLGEKRGYLREDSSELIGLNNRIRALERQASIERGRLVGSGDDQMSGLLESYQPLEQRHQLAQQRYAAALGSLENARLEAQRQKQYLVTFIPPSLPDEAVEPHRLYGVLTVAVFALLIHLIGGLMWSALRDHIGR